MLVLHHPEPLWQGDLCPASPSWALLFSWESACFPLSYIINPRVSSCLLSLGKCSNPGLQFAASERTGPSDCCILFFLTCIFTHLFFWVALKCDKRPTNNIGDKRHCFTIKKDMPSKVWVIFFVSINENSLTHKFFRMKLSVANTLLKHPYILTGFSANCQSLPMSSFWMCYFISQRYMTVMLESDQPSRLGWVLRTSGNVYFKNSLFSLPLCPLWFNKT